MLWLNPWLLSGLAALALPVIIHLAMRRRPQRISFPAAHLVRQSNVAGGGRTRLRHLLLMALRMAVLAGFVLALARPVQPDSATPIVAGNAAAAVVLCFDNSPSMAYTVGGRSRLEEAAEQAEAILTALPAGSRAAVIDLQSAAQINQLQSEPTLSRRDLKALQVEAVSRPISRLIRSAAALLREAPEVRREIYVFSDLQPAAVSDLTALLFAEMGEIGVYIIDLSPQEGQNVALGIPRLSSPLVALGARAAMSVDVVGDERSARRTILLQRDGQTRERRTVELDTPFARSQVEFITSVERLGPLQGRVLIDEPDALAADNVRYFTLHAGEPPAALLVGKRSSTPGRLSPAQLVAKALSPDDFAARPPVATRIVDADRLTAEPLGPFEAVFLCDAATLSAEAVTVLEEYVRAGGHLVVIAGPDMAASVQNADSIYRSPTMAQLLGAKISGASLWNAGSRFTVVDWQSAALAPFDGGRKGDPGLPIIYRALDVRPSDGSSVLLTVGNGQPALITAVRGAGRVHLLATGLDAKWSNLPAQPYEFVPLMHGLLAAGRGGLASAMVIGEPVNYVFPRQLAGLEAVLSGPGLTAPIRRTIAPGAATVQFPPLRQPGNYQIRVIRDGRDHFFGFSLNIEAAESERGPVDAEVIRAAFAPGAVSLSRTANDVQLRLAATPRSRELSALIVPLLMLAMVIELLLANRFYGLRRKSVEISH